MRIQTAPNSTAQTASSSAPYIRAIRLDQAFLAACRPGGRRGRHPSLCGTVPRNTWQEGLLWDSCLPSCNYLGRVLSPISTFSRVGGRILSAMASAERVFGILDLKTEMAEAKIVERGLEPVEAETLPPFEGKVEFDRDLLDTGKEPVLHDVSFTVEPGNL